MSQKILRTTAIKAKFFGMVTFVEIDLTWVLFPKINP
jgi:hypothetical protein